MIPVYPLLNSDNCVRCYYPHFISEDSQVQRGYGALSPLAIERQAWACKISRLIPLETVELSELEQTQFVS